MNGSSPYGLNYLSSFPVERQLLKNKYEGTEKSVVRAVWNELYPITVLIFCAINTQNSLEVIY